MIAPIQTTVPAADQIESIMRSFDFARMHQVMVALDWRWHQQGVPSVYVLINSARERLESLGHGGVFETSSGGFVASIDCWGWYSLAFVVTDYSASESFPSD